ncbi:unnamed protein product [Lathyrus sativus]|nr:unnamed protein product [Lathyrus sativus]
METGRGRPKKKKVLSPLVHTLEMEKGTDNGSTSKSMESSQHEEQEIVKENKGDPKVSEVEERMNIKTNHEEEPPKKL